MAAHKLIVPESVTIEQHGWKVETTVVAFGVLPRSLELKSGSSGRFEKIDFVRPDMLFGPFCCTTRCVYDLRGCRAVVDHLKP